jgi:hypothetical protein
MTPEKPHDSRFSAWDYEKMAKALTHQPEILFFTVQD